MATPANAFVSRLKSDIATLSSDKLNLEEQNANLQQQNGNLQNEVLALQRKLDIVAQASSNGFGNPVGFNKIVELEDQLAQERAEFKEFMSAANDDVSKAEATTSHWKGKVEDEQRYSASLKRQLDDAKDTMKAFQAQKAYAEKKARDASALALKQTAELAKAQKQKRAAQAKHSREIISRDIDTSETTKFNFSTPKAFTKRTPKSLSTFGNNKVAPTKPASSKVTGKHPSDPSAKNQPPSKSMSQLGIGKSKDTPLVLDEDEDDMPLAQRRAMTGSKRKAVNQQDEEDQDDEEFLPIRIKRERIE